MYESGPGEVDELEHAEGRRGFGEPDRARGPARLEHDDLARLDVADVLGADDVEAGGLGGQDPARRLVGGRVAPQAGRVAVALFGRQPTQDERPESERIADPDHPPLVQDDHADRDGKEAEAQHGHGDEHGEVEQAERQPARQVGRVCVGPALQRDSEIEIGAKAPGTRHSSRV